MNTVCHILYCGWKYRVLNTVVSNCVSLALLVRLTDHQIIATMTKRKYHSSHYICKVLSIWFESIRCLQQKSNFFVRKQVDKVWFKHSIVMVGKCFWFLLIGTRPFIWINNGYSEATVESILSKNCLNSFLVDFHGFLWLNGAELLLFTFESLG